MLDGVQDKAVDEPYPMTIRNMAVVKFCGATTWLAYLFEVVLASPLDWNLKTASTTIDPDDFAV
jgi:hypothetical protein